MARSVTISTAPCNRDVMHKIVKESAVLVCYLVLVNASDEKYNKESLHKSHQRVTNQKWHEIIREEQGTKSCP